jgi:hypothetical protein
MPTNLAIDDELLEEALRVGGARRIDDAVPRELAELIQEGRVT